MNEVKGQRLHVMLGASQVRRRLEGRGFSDRRRSVATGKVDEEHALGCPDGDIFLTLK